MKVETRRWVAQHPTLPIGSYQTSVIVLDTAGTTAATFPGRLTRKAALDRMWNHLVGSHQWSTGFLKRFRDATQPRRMKG